MTVKSDVQNEWRAYARMEVEYGKLRLDHHLLVRKLAAKDARIKELEGSIKELLQLQTKEALLRDSDICIHWGECHD